MMGEDWEYGHAYVERSTIIPDDKSDSVSFDPEKFDIVTGKVKFHRDARNRDKADRVVQRTDFN